MSDRTRIAIGLDEDSDAEKFKADLRGKLLQRYGKRKGTSWQNLAADAGLCVATLSNFAQGITKKPQSDTLIRIGLAVGWRVSGWYDTETGKTISLGSYAKHVPESVRKRLYEGAPAKTLNKKKKKTNKR